MEDHDHKEAKETKTLNMPKKPLVSMAAGLLAVLVIAVAALFFFRLNAATSAECFDFNSTTGAIRYYRHDDERCGAIVKIPKKIDGVTVEIIGPAAFRRKDLTKVRLPDTVTSIKDDAFADNSITKVYWSDALTEISSAAFKNNQLTEVKLPDNVTSIRRDAFMDNQIKIVSFGKRVENIEEGAFKNNEIQILTIPDSIKTIRREAFENNQIRELVIGKNVTYLGYRAFHGNGLDKITIAGDANRFNDQWVTIGFPQDKRATTQ